MTAGLIALAIGAFIAGGVGISMDIREAAIRLAAESEAQ